MEMAPDGGSLYPPADAMKRTNSLVVDDERSGGLCVPHSFDPFFSPFSYIRTFYIYPPDTDDGNRSSHHHLQPFATVRARIYLLFTVESFSIRVAAAFSSIPDDDSSLSTS